MVNAKVLYKSILKSTILAGCCFYLIFLLPKKADAAVINVSSIPALQSAINSAVSGDVIVLANNTYLNSTININTSNITVRSATPGGVFLNGTNSIVISGNNVNFSGFQFTSGSIAGVVIAVSGNYVQLTQLNFKGYSAQKYINLQGQYDEVSFCNFENKPTSAPIGNLVHIAPNGTVPNYAKIRYCSFRNMSGAGGDNGNECIRIANGAQSTFLCRTIVEFCYFENTGAGDSEAISVKSRENILRFNTFRNNQNAMMVFRNGNDNVAYGNYFINAGGIRVKEANNVFCYNNYFENAGVGGTMTAVSYDFVSGNLKNINFLHNTFVECGLIELSSGATNNTWTNNIFKKNSGNIFSGSASGITWAGNIYQGSLGISIPSGMTNSDPALVLNSENYFGLSASSPAINNSSSTYPAILDIVNMDDDPSLAFDISGQPRPSVKTEKDAGCDEYTTGNTTNRPLVLSQVGPSYLGGPGGIVKQDQTITFGSLPSKVLGAADFNPGATASSGLVVTYSSSNTAVATIVNGNIHIVGAGTSSITAAQSGDANFNAATSVVQPLTVTAPISNTYTYTTTSVSILSGTLNSGNVGNLATNNSSYYVVGSTTSGTRRTDWYGSVVISQSPASVTKLTITYDGKYSASKGQLLYLYNWVTASWTQIDSRTVSSTDLLIKNTQTLPSKFISSTGEIRLRVFSSGGNKNYTASGDWLTFAIETSASAKAMEIPTTTFETEILSDFSIYPNPASTTLFVNYRLNAVENVELALFDMNGQRVKTCLANQKQNAGNYNKSLDISNLNQGVYILRYSAGIKSKSVKLVVLK